jgi:IclR family transcriptional regulator, acetate operon repressor
MVGKSRVVRPTSFEQPPGGRLAGSVQSLERGLNLLAIIAEADGLSLTSIAQRAGIAPSTAHRILNTLRAGGFVLDDDRGRYLIGLQAFRIGSAFLRNRKMVDVGRSTMRHLMETSGETVNMGIENDGSVVFVLQIETHQTIRAFHRPGARGPIHASSVGKAIMASLSDKALAQLLHHVGMPRFTKHTIVDPDALHADLAAVRKRGWSIDDQEHSEGLRCVGAAVYNEHGEVMGAISISGPTVRITEERLGELGPMVKRAAAEITERVGGRMPDATD